MRRLDYSTLETLPRRKETTITRVNSCHILFVKIRHTVPALKKNTLKLEGKIELDYQDRFYFLMKRSGKKRWGDISLFNYNVEWEAGLQVSEEAIQACYHKANMDLSEKLREHISAEYNVMGHVFNIRPIMAAPNNDLPLYYLKQSLTVNTLTLYMFYPYVLSPYRVREGMIKTGKLWAQPEIRREIEFITNRDLFGLFSDACRNGSHPEFIDRLQTDQINDLVSRDMSVLIPDYFFEKTALELLHPNHQFHSVINLLCHSSFNPFPLIHDSIEYIDQRKSEKNLGIIAIDLVHFRNFHNKYNVDHSFDLEKAFQNDMTEIIHRNSGYIFHVAGDGFLAVVQDAINPMHSLLKMAFEIQARPWRTRIGLNCVKRPFFSGYMGALELGNYGFSGADINIAARLEQRMKRLENQGILMPANQIEENELASLLQKQYKQRPQIRYRVETLSLDGIPEMGGSAKSNWYYYIIRV